MRYCVSRSSGGSPEATRRSNNDTPRPASAASREQTVAGSWAGSPTSTAACALDKAIKTSGSVAWVASSMMQKLYCRFPIMPAAAETHVANTTSADLRTSRAISVSNFWASCENCHMRSVRPKPLYMAAFSLNSDAFLAASWFAIFASSV